MKTTEQQQAFIDRFSNTKDSIRLEAVAGSGKTTTLTLAAQHLPANGKHLALAFNKSIATTLKERMPFNVDCSTFNSIGLSTWRSAERTVKTSAWKINSIARDLFKAHFAKEEDISPADLADAARATRVWIYGQVSRQGYSADDILDSNHRLGALEYISLKEALENADLDIFVSEPIVRVAFEIAQLSLRNHKEIDFDEQLLLPLLFPEKVMFPRYDTIFIDEAQDLSPIQQDFIDNLRFPPESTRQTRVIAVGDARQAIYAWRGADAQSLDTLTARFGLSKMPLTFTFRCPKQIVAQVETHVTPRVDIQCTPNAPEGQVESLGDKWGPDDIPPGSAVICRNNAPLVRLALALLASSRPIYYSGRDLAKTFSRIVEDFKQGAWENHFQEWMAAKLADAKTEAAKQRIEDYAACLFTILQYTRDVTGKDQPSDTDMLNTILKLFPEGDTATTSAVHLTTIHKAKGLEWANVFILDFHLCPNPRLVKMKDEYDRAGADAPDWLGELLLQEQNLRYVALTRSMDRLTFILTPKKEKQ